MNLKSFRVRNFTSVNDSGPISMGPRTALVGRNESGKTNLLLALESLNPSEDMTEMTFVKHFRSEGLLHKSRSSPRRTSMW